MAPKSQSQSRQPTKEKQNEEPSSDEEDDDETESGSEVDSFDEEKANLPNEEDHKEASSEDNEEEEEEEEEEDDDDDDDEQKVKSNSIPTPVPKIDPKSVAQENGADSDPESEGSPSDYKLQPISKSPLSAKKRVRQESGNSAMDSKKSKTEEKKASTNTPGGCINRLWSNEDEIAVLNGMIEFKNVKGPDPYGDWGAFYNFIKGKLQVDFSRDQLRTKISRMKKRFLNALKRGENGEDPIFSKPHECLAFELSKKIWGGGVGNSEVSSKKDSTVNSTHEKVKKEIVKVQKTGADEKQIVTKEHDWEEGVNLSNYPFFSRSFGCLAGNSPSLAMSEVGLNFMKQRLSRLGNAKIKELDEKWKQLIAEEAEVSHKMMNLMKEQVKMVMDH